MQKQISNKRVALITGSSLLLMAVVAGFTIGLVFNSVFITDSNQFKTEFHKIESFFYLGLIGWIVILFLDVVVSWGLYKLYKEKNIVKSTIMGGLRLVYSLVLAVAIYKLSGVIYLINEVDTNNEKIFNLLDDFQSIWHFGLIIFGFHLMVLASLVCNKRKINYVLSFLLLVAGIGYMLSNVCDLFITEYELYRTNVEAIFIIPMVFGEIGLAIWLLVKGGKETKTF